MDMVSYIIGFSVGLVVIAKVKMSKIIIKKNKALKGNEIYEFNMPHNTMFCQTCRKLKKHKEVKLNLYQCVKCKRNVDLRRAS
jgi:hypothetical protein